MADETYSIKGGADVQWGVDAASSLGTVITHEVDSDAKYEVIENASGAVTGLVVYDTETVVKLTVVAKAASALPAMGDVIEVGTLKGVVLHAAQKASSKTTVKFEISISSWTNLSLT